jgi:hypothetical protein
VEAETLLVRGEVGSIEDALPIGDVEQERVESPSTSLASLIMVTLMSGSKKEFSAEELCPTDGQDETRPIASEPIQDDIVDQAHDVESDSSMRNL